MNKVLFKDNSIKNVDSIQKIKNKDDIKMVMLHLNTLTLGDFWYGVKHKTVKKMKQIKKIELKYKFMNGIEVDPDDRDAISISYSFAYDNIHDFLAKYIEINIAERPLNDYVWVNESFYCYCFWDLKVKVTFKGNKTKKFSLNKFVEYLNLEFFRDDVRIYEKDKTWEFKNKAFKKLDKDLNMINIFGTLYLPVTDYFNKINTLDASLVVKGIDTTGEEEESFEYDIHASYNKTKRGRVGILFALPMHVEILRQYFESSYNEYMSSESHIKVNVLLNKKRVPLKKVQKKLLDRKHQGLY